MKNIEYIKEEINGFTRQINPITKQEVISVSDRKNRPLTPNAQKQKIDYNKKGNFCSFCSKNYLKTTPEKSRIIETQNNSFSRIDNIKFEKLFQTKALFRKISNLFEIIPFQYWREKYNFKLSRKNKQHKKEYISSPGGKKHVIDLIDYKLKAGNILPNSISENEKLKIADYFFGGSHELIIAQKHFSNNAIFDDDFFSCGDFSTKEHQEYFLFTLNSLKNIYKNNKNVKFVTVFQNWLNPAGASLNHLHKQLVGIDETPPFVEQKLNIIKKDKNFYNDCLIEYARKQDLILAYNKHAVAFCDFGYRFPTISVYAKNFCPIEDDNEDKTRDFCDVLHAVYKSLGGKIPCNEEWYYSPIYEKTKIPFHTSLKLRVNNPAGFEAITGVFVNAISPYELKEITLDRLKKLKQEGLINENIKFYN